MVKVIKVRRLKGWSTGGRPFSPKQYQTSHLKKNTHVSYANYLAECAKILKRKGGKI